MKVQTEQAFQAVGVSIRTTNEAEMSASGKIGPLWQEFMARDLQARLPHRADADLLAVYTDYASDQHGVYTYCICARVTSVADLPAGLVSVTVPAGRYAVLTTERGPLPRIVPAMWQRIWSLSPAELGGERAFRADYEVYPAGVDPADAQVDVHVGLQ